MMPLSFHYFHILMPPFRFVFDIMPAAAAITLIRRLFSADFAFH